MSDNKVWAIIDDIRELNCELIAKNARDGLTMVMENFDRIECLCLDHDLGEVLNGYDVLCHLMYKGFVPDHVQLVTSNPVGRANMASVLERNGYETKDGRNFYKVEK
jgi:hypothetical protein